jgi:sigma-B regulation protein RsbU (phosphoserine phosphatase)
MRVLIADDSEDARDILRATLTSGGYNDVVAVESGAEAVAYLKVGDTRAPSEAIDIVLMDVVMPQMDGIEACARIRQDPRYQDLPIVMVTSMDDMSSLAQAFVGGATDYVVKPFQPVELLVRVRNALKLKGELDRRIKREASLKAANEQLRTAVAPPFAAIDRDTGFLSRVAFEETLRDGAIGVGWVAALQIDALPAFEEHYGAEAAEELSRRLSACVAVTRGPMGSLICPYEPGLVVIAMPPISADEVRQVLEACRQIMLQLAVPHRDSPARGVVTVSGAYAPHSQKMGGMSLANAFNTLADVSSRGGDQLIQYQET